MKAILFASFVLLVSILLAACAPAAATPAPATAIAGLDDGTVTVIENLIEKHMEESQVPGYAMCIVKDGQVVYNKGFGVLEKGKDGLVTPQSLFGLRSVSKTFTAIALMQMVEQGKVDINAAVTEYLPYFKMADDRYDRITVRMLLSHTSGLSDEVWKEAFSNKMDEPVESAAAMEWFVRGLANDNLVSHPGTQFNYAGANFTVIADIIGKASGLGYEQYVDQFILKPLHMDNSTFDASTVPADLLAAEHVDAGDGSVVASAPESLLRSDAPAGLLYSSCDDMLRYTLMNLNRGELNGAVILQPESYDAMWRTQTTTGLLEALGPHNGPPYGAYGLGWYVGLKSGHRLAGHGGGGNGYNTQIELAPNDNVGVVVLSNWLVDSPSNDRFPASFAAIDVLYELLDLQSGS